MPERAHMRLWVVLFLWVLGFGGVLLFSFVMVLRVVFVIGCFWSWFWELFGLSFLVLWVSFWGYWAHEVR